MIINQPLSGVSRTVIAAVFPHNSFITSDARVLTTAPTADLASQKEALATTSFGQQRYFLFGL
jgi:hypothetical protein